MRELLIFSTITSCQTAISSHYNRATKLQQTSGRFMSTVCKTGAAKLHHHKAVENRLPEKPLPLKA